MKKIVCLAVVALMIGCAAFGAKKVAIKPADVASLKGTWEGIINFGEYEGGGTSPATLEILNDKAPVKARFTIQNVPSPVANAFAVSTGKASAENDNGTLTSQGTIVWLGTGANMFEVSLNSAKQLNAWYYFRGMKGEGTFTKK